jgi:hypothetical protein
LHLRIESSPLPPGEAGVSPRAPGEGARTRTLSNSRKNPHDYPRRTQTLAAIIALRQANFCLDGDPNPSLQTLAGSEPLIKDSERRD